LGLKKKVHFGRTVQGGTSDRLREFLRRTPDGRAERRRNNRKETEQIANFEKEGKRIEKKIFRSEKPRGLTQEPITQKPWDFRGRSGTSQRVDIKQNKNFAQ